MLTIELVTNPIVASPDGNFIAMTVKFAEFPEPIQFMATATDVTEHGQKLFADAKAGVYGPLPDYVPPPEGVSYGPQPEPA